MRGSRYGMRDAGSRFSRGRCGACFGPLLAALALTGCTAPRQALPDWLMNPPAAYPPAQYLVSLGEGDSRRAAENSAAAGLARIFEANIRASESLSETTVETRGAKETLDRFSELRSAVQIVSDQPLLNVRFGETFTDARGRVHTAAFLQRAETAAIYRDKILENARDIAFLIQRSDADADPVRKYAFRRAAVRKSLKNDTLLEPLRIISPQVHGALSLGYDPQTLYAETAALAHAVTFSLDIRESAAREALADALTAMGFSEAAEAPALAFSGTASFEKTDLRSGALVFIRWRFSMEMRDRAGRLALSFQKSSREGHITFEEAQARAQRTLKTESAALLRTEIGRYFDRLAAAE